MSDTAAADIDRVWALIDDLPVAMVVTHEEGRHMRARPMAMRPARAEGVIYFLTDVDAPKVEEIRRNEFDLPRAGGQQKPKIRVDHRACGAHRRS